MNLAVVTRRLRHQVGTQSLSVRTQVVVYKIDAPNHIVESRPVIAESALARPAPRSRNANAQY